MHVVHFSVHFGSIEASPQWPLRAKSGPLLTPSLPRQSAGQDVTNTIILLPP